VTFVTVTKYQKFEFVTEYVFLFFFELFLAKQVGYIFVTNVTNGHTVNCDWYKSVSVSVSIEMGTFNLCFLRLLLQIMFSFLFFYWVILGVSPRCHGKLFVGGE